MDRRSLLGLLSAAPALRLSSPPSVTPLTDEIRMQLLERHLGTERGRALLFESYESALANGRRVDRSHPSVRRALTMIRDLSSGSEPYVLDLEARIAELPS